MFSVWWYGLKSMHFDHFYVLENFYGKIKSIPSRIIKWYFLSYTIISCFVKIFSNHDHSRWGAMEKRYKTRNVSRVVPPVSLHIKAMWQLPRTGKIAQYPHLQGWGPAYWRPTAWGREPDSRLRAASYPAGLAKGRPELTHRKYVWCATHGTEKRSGRTTDKTLNPIC